LTPFLSENGPVFLFLTCVFLIYMSFSVTMSNSSLYIKVELYVTFGFFDTPLPLNAPTVWCKNCVFCNLRDRWYAGL